MKDGTILKNVEVLTVVTAIQTHISTLYHEIVKARFHGFKSTCDAWIIPILVTRRKHGKSLERCGIKRRKFVEKNEK